MSWRRPGLVQRGFFSLLLVLLVVQGITLLLTSRLILMPIMTQSVRDFATVLLDAAEDSRQIPAQLLPQLQQRLQQRWQLKLLKPDQLPDGKTSLLWYNQLLSEELSRRSGQVIRVMAGQRGQQRWYWVSLPPLQGKWVLGFPQQRIGTHPPLVVALLVLTALAFSLAMAYFLAQLLYRPLQNLLQVARSLGRGEQPRLIRFRASREVNELQDQFAALATDVYELLQQRSTLLVGVSHELRTPLTRMQLILELARQQLPAEVHGRMQQEVEVMEQIIHQFMQLGRGVEAGGEECRALNEIIDESIALCAQPQRVEFQHPQGTPHQVRVNPQALQRVLCNLLDNALKYSQSTVSVTALDSFKGVRICVLDRGSGIDASLQTELQQPFTQLTGGAGGIGLGLAIVRLLTQTHGWTFLLQARKAGGTAACLFVPAEPGSRL